MSVLSDFLAKNNVEEMYGEIENLSPRLKGFTFKYKAMTIEEHAEYKRISTVKGKGKRPDSFDDQLYMTTIVLNQCVEPNFKSADEIKNAGCKTKEQYLGRALLAGEIITLSNKIINLSGFNVSLEEDVEEAKNS